MREEKPMIDFWYGDRQAFGARASSQRWINVLGRIAHSERAVRCWYRLNGGEPRPLGLGPDYHRLARPGDLNVEMDQADLEAGLNRVRFGAERESTRYRAKIWAADTPLRESRFSSTLRIGYENIPRYLSALCSF